MASAAKSGYILLLTTFIIATSILLISFVVSKVATYRQLTQLMADKDKARIIAHSGIAIAMSQLMIFTEKEDKQKPQPTTNKPNETTKAESKNNDSASDFVLKQLNKWQTFDLTEKADGMDATCYVYITSEQGKINLNNLYDTEKKQFKVLGTTDGKKVAEFIADRLKPIFESTGKKIDLAQLIEQAFKKREALLDDVSQFLTKENEDLQNYLFPSYDNKDKITLLDLFTTAKTQGTHPLALTPSLKQIAGLRPLDKKNKDQPSNEQIDNIIKSPVNDWQKAWKPALELIHGKDYTQIPETIKSLFANKFEQNLFFVVSYGKVGAVTERVAALIEKNQTGTTKEKPFIIRKLYWQ